MFVCIRPMSAPYAYLYCLMDPCEQISLSKVDDKDDSASACEAIQNAILLQQFLWLPV